MASRISWLVALALCLPGAAVGQPEVEVDTTLEYRVKAAFLYNFTKFIEWPEEAFEGRPEFLVIGVYGEDPFGLVLEETFEGKLVDGRALLIRRADTLRAVADSHVVFVARGEEEVPGILAELSGRPVLTVADSPDFAKRGGMIGFRIESERVRFDINQIELEAAGLVASSRLLSLATVVETTAPGSRPDSDPEPED